MTQDLTPPEAPHQDAFESLSLWQVLRLMLRHPQATAKRFIAATTLPPEDVPERYAETPEQDIWADEEDTPADTLPEPDVEDISPQPEATVEAIPNLPYVRLLGILLVSILLVCIGGLRLWNAATNPQNLASGDTGGAFVWFGLAFVVYCGGLLSVYVPRWRTRAKPITTPPEVTPSQAPVALGDRFLDAVARHSLRLTLMPVGVILAFLAYSQNTITNEIGRVTDVRFTTPGTVAWFAAIFCWFLILGVDLNGMWAKWRRGQLRLPRLRLAGRWHWIALLVVMLVAGYFRLHDLSGVPPEMTSDHIEKLLDARRVSEGYTAIFFPNNGGREAFQMHFIAWMIELGGLEFSFDALKLATVIEGLLTVLLGFWFAVTLIGRDTAEQRQMGIWLGVMFAALLAISSWHTMLSRLGLRIALTPLTTMLVTIFLIRGMRHNRRSDFVLMGLALGFGTYFYQANRMLPLLAIAGTVLAMLINARRLPDAGRYALNLACAGLMAVVIFLPMYRYSDAFPDEFWNRTRGRMFGENAFVRVNPETGLNERYEPTISEQIERFVDEADTFRENYVDALEMWGWQGDSAWINNGRGRPALDPYTHALMLLGIVGWLALFFKRWDVAYLLIPTGIVIMLLPSAMTIAYQIENPSFTRASGTIPFVFALAAYPLARVGFYAQQVIRTRWLNLLLVGVLVVPILVLAGRMNFTNYFETYRDSYAQSWKPYSSIAQPMRDFARGEGSYGNAFMIAYPHWLDHRILAVAAGDIDWDNGLVTRNDVFGFIERNAGTPYAYDPTRPTFFMANLADQETIEWLQTLFPDGREEIALVPDNTSLNFYVMIAPPDIDWADVQTQAEALAADGS